MPNINFPSNPANGATYSFNNVFYVFDGTVWMSLASGNVSGLSTTLAVSNNAGVYAIDMNYNKITNLATASNDLDATNYLQVQNDILDARGAMFAQMNGFTSF